MSLGRKVAAEYLGTFGSFSGAAAAPIMGAALAGIAYPAIASGPEKA